VKLWTNTMFLFKWLWGFLNQTVDLVISYFDIFVVFISETIIFVFFAFLVSPCDSVRKNKKSCLLVLWFNISPGQLDFHFLNIYYNTILTFTRANISQNLWQIKFRPKAALILSAVEISVKNHLWHQVL
jgi:hypothetical protein